MRDINIFIAGGQDLKSYREKIKVVAMDLNSKLAQNDGDITLKTASFENFRNNQQAYNDFICNKADLVIFVLEDKLGPYTKGELILALDNKDKVKHPDVVIFLRSYENETNEIAYLNGMLAREDYYIRFESEEDLAHRVKSYIEDTYIPLVKDRDKKRKSFSISFPNILKQVRYAIVCCLAILLMGLSVCLYMRFQSPVLLISGGGSARNYIDLYHGVELEKYPLSYYVHMPTSNAWLLLTEEVISPQKNPKYYPLCVSASTAKDEDFLKITTKDHFLKAGSVIEMRLGYDTVAVCIKNDPEIISILDPLNLSRGEVSVSDLAKLVKATDKLNVFATSPGSGTRTSYANMLIKENVDLDDYCTRQFSEYSDLASINKNGLPYMLLGSKCYTMSELGNIVKSGGAKQLKVFEEEGGEKKYKCKPINLYFMAYARDNTNNLEIPQQTLDFLSSIDIDYSQKVCNNKVKRYTVDNVIISYDLLPKW